MARPLSPLQYDNEPATVTLSRCAFAAKTRTWRKFPCRRIERDALSYGICNGLW